MCSLAVPCVLSFLRLTPKHWANSMPDPDVQIGISNTHRADLGRASGRCMSCTNCAGFVVLCASSLDCSMKTPARSPCYSRGAQRAGSYTQRARCLELSPCNTQRAGSCYSMGTTICAAGVALLQVQFHTKIIQHHPLFLVAVLHAVDRVGSFFTAAPCSHLPFSRNAAFVVFTPQQCH